MAFTNIRQGARTLVAAKFQTALGTPNAVWANADILRAEEFEMDPGQEWTAQQGTHGSLYEIATAVEVSRTPTVEASVKAGPDNLRMFLENCLGVAPIVAAPVPPSTFSTYKFEGFNADFPGNRWLTVVEDTGPGVPFETLRVSDFWAHTLRLVSAAKENLILEVEGSAYNFDYLAATSQLAGLALANIESYSHKGSVLIDDPLGVPVNIAVESFECEIDHGREIINANSVAPTFLAKDGRIVVSGTIGFGRVYTDTIVFLQRVLNTTLSTLKAEWTATTGKKLKLTLRNVHLRGTFPAISADGTMDDFELDFTAYQTPPGGAFPFTIEVED